MKTLQSAFTLVELLIVIAILGVIASILVVVLNPAELLRETRDTNRVSSLSSLDRAIGLYNTGVVTTGGTPDLGADQTVYLSLPDTNADCSSYTTLPALDPGWSYACVSEADLFKIDGTGWIPVDFTQTTPNAISSLPIDPLNTVEGGLYYTYVQGSWELTSSLESSKYQTRYEGGILQVGSTNSITPEIILTRGEGGEAPQEPFSEDFETYTVGEEQPGGWLIYSDFASGSPSTDTKQVQNDKAKTGSQSYKIENAMVRSCSNGATSRKSVQVFNVPKGTNLQFSAWGENLHGPGGEATVGARIGLTVVFNLNDESFVSILYKTHEMSGKTGSTSFYKNDSWRGANVRYDLGFTQNVWVDVTRNLRDDFNANFTENDFDADVVDLDIAIGGQTYTSQCSNSHGFRGWFDDIEVSDS